MNRFFTRRNVIIAIIAILITGALLWIAYSFTHTESRRSVMFNFDDSVKSITVSNDVESCESDTCSSESFEKTLSDPGSMELLDGTYHVAATGDKITSQAIKITVDSTHTIFTIKPHYSDTYLASLLTNELTAIKSHIHADYPQTTSYVIEPGKLYQFGEWYATSLALPVSEATLRPDTYYVILHKTANAWHIVGKPSLYFKYSEHTDIPKEIMEEINTNIINTSGSVPTTETDGEEP